MYIELRSDYKHETKVLPKYTKGYIVGVIKNEEDKSKDWKYLIRFGKEEILVSKEDINIL